jgi:hypothetical protein
LRLAEGHRTQAQTPANRLPVTTESHGHAAKFVLHILHFIPWWKLNCNPDLVFATMSVTHNHHSPTKDLELE